MSMTRDEIIEAYESAVFSSGLSAAAGNEEAAKDYELLKAGLNALRGPTREIVEEMRGEWIEDEFAISHCSLCGYEHEEPEIITPFCPLCGSPMTDEAVQMVMERLEALKDAES